MQTVTSVFIIVQMIKRKSAIPVQMGVTIRWNEMLFAVTLLEYATVGVVGDPLHTKGHYRYVAHDWQLSILPLQHAHVPALSLSLSVSWHEGKNNAIMPSQNAVLCRLLY